MVTGNYYSVMSLNHIRIYRLHDQSGLDGCIIFKSYLNYISELVLLKLHLMP